MSVLDHFLTKAAPAERGDFDSASRAAGRTTGIVRMAMYVLAGVIGTALAIALDPVVNLFAGD
ncbi:MAG TPA: hypothetical protein PK417_12305 [Hyphomonas sp.]|nr:hypothetical protein [Hyphomonas sp.]